MTNGATNPSGSWAVVPPADVVASVELGPVPEIPLAALRDTIVPELDAEGRLVDWVVDVGALHDRGTMAAYWAWRALWRRRWGVGPISNLAAFERCSIRLGHDVGQELRELFALLVVRGGDGVELDPSRGATIVGELEAARETLAAVGRDVARGFGIVDDTPARTAGTGLARAWVDDAVEVVLAASPVTAVVARPREGLVVLHDGPRFRPFGRVTCVDMVGDVAVISGAGGGRLTLAPEAARPLAWVVPRSLRWHVREIPLATVWTPLFVGLPQAVAAAREAGSSIRFSAILPLRTEA
jgi:hypothetical protein